MPDWSKVAGTRAENARKAMELLENTAGKGYEFTPEEGQDMISGLEDALNSLKLAYKDRVPVVGKNTPAAVSEELRVLSSPVIAVEAGDTPRYLEDSELIAISNSRNDPSSGGHVVNTCTDQPLTIPHRAQIKEFVLAVPCNHLAGYVLHIGDRMYEDAVGNDA